MQDLEKIRKKLDELRDNPADTSSAGRDVLSLLSDYLTQTQTLGGPIHWFCERADRTTVDAATFLLRLHAYDADSEGIKVWRQHLTKCLKGCGGCVGALAEVKDSSRNTFFGAFAVETLKGFWTDFGTWELGLVKSGLQEAKFTLDNTSNHTLDDLPAPLLCHILTNTDILLDPEVLSLVRLYVPSTSSPSVPVDPPLCGLLLLVFDQDENTRLWARNQIRTSKLLKEEQVSSPYCRVLEKIASTISPTKGTDRPASFSADLSVIWSGVAQVLRLLPPEYLVTTKARQLELHRAVLGRLHDQGPHFIDVLRSLIVLCKRMNAELWAEEANSTDYPQVIFDAIKDNPAYTELLLKPEVANWLLSWFMDFLSSIWSLPVLGNVVAKIVDFLCEELQHERFQELRPSGMLTAARLIASIDRKSKDGGTLHQRELSGHAVDIHCGIFISVAFDRTYNNDKWAEARKASREVVKNVLATDTIAVSEAITRLSRRAAGKTDTLLVPSLRKQMWKGTYATMQGSDADGMAMVISVVASSAHVDKLTAKAFQKLFQEKDGRAAENVFAVVNQALDVFHAGFLDAASKFANYSPSSVILDLFRRPGMVKDIIALMLCPIDDIQVAAQTLVGQAFDVDVRQDCFRALIENLSEASLSGIFNFLDTFIHYASLVPEACSLSKSIVRCMTDVIDVLCSSTDGLLRSQTFTRKRDDGPGPAGELPRWWKLMTQTISVIFNRTPGWSLHFESGNMVVWMRDALIFGRDMLAQWRVIEGAAVAVSAEAATLKPGRMSRIGRRMVEDLKEVLPELGRWLRLTDEELLHQSFALLETLLACFKETQVAPPEAGIAKLTKHIQDARKKDKDPKRPQTRLDSARLAKLENALASFQDDEVEIISHTIRGKDKKVEKSDSDVEIVVGPVKKEKEVRKGSSPPARKEGKIRFKPSITAASSKATITSFFGSDGKKKSTAPPPKAPQWKGREQPIPAKPHILPPPVRNTEVKKPKPAPSEPSSSSEGSDSDESAEEGGLAALAKIQRTPKIKQPTERRQIKMLEVPGQRNAAMERMNRREDLRRTQLRLKPDVTGLHRTLLSWDYDHSGTEPPYHGPKPPYLQIPDKFNDHDQYRRVFEPLFMMECWAQIVKSKDEPDDSYQCTIQSRQFVDDWLDLSITVPDQVKKDWRLMETDVVLLRHLDGKKSALAKTQSYRATPMGITATLRCMVGNRGDPGLQNNTSWRLSKVMSLSTLHREYATLMAVPFYDVFDTVLRPTLTKKPYIDRRDLQQAMETYGVNEPQAAAILSSLRVEGFSLIQGPPGTGKTSTICGLVQAYLAKRPRATTTINAGRSAGPADKSIPPKILLCAPSNAAIDEVAHRVKDGTLGSGKQGICPKVVRVGGENSINIGVKDISLDFLVDQRLNSSSDVNPREGTNEIDVIRKELDFVKKQRQEKQEEASKIQNNAARTMTLDEEIKKLNQRRMALTQQFDRLKDKQKSDYRTLDAVRRKCRKEILQEADVICGTLSGTGHEALQLEEFDFEMVVIDEAAQAIELSSLIPLKYKCRRCIMVGDPQQLPPTVLSLEAYKYQYNQSLFVRFQKDKPDAVHLLSIQYRMHPDISRLPSRVFYQGKLLDGPNMDVKTKQPWHTHEKFGPYKFFNVSRGQEVTSQSHSLVNKLEAQVAVALFNRLRQEFSSFDFDFKVGVISMYRAQIGELRRAFTQRFGQDIVGRVDFNTVDGFQGQEKDVIILSCVRAGPGLTNVGFLADTRRMNVALTRAKSSLFIIGHTPTLERSDKHWQQIIVDARSRTAVVDTDVLYFTAGSSRPAPKAHPAPKISKHLAPNPMSTIPTDLINPHDIRKPPSAREIPGSSARIEGQGLESLDLQTPTSLASRSAQKRPALPDHEPRPPPANRPPRPPQPNGEGSKPQPRPRPPPPKRDKGGPNLFIPKKRSAPDGDAGNPPAKRRQ